MPAAASLWRCGGRDVDFDRGALAFTRSAVAGPDGVELRPTKTRRTYRVEIDADTLAVLADYRVGLESSGGLRGLPVHLDARPVEAVVAEPDPGAVPVPA